MKMRHITVGLVIFAILINLFMGFYSSVDDVYNIPTSDIIVADGCQQTTIGERMQSLRIIEGLEDVMSIFSALQAGNAIDLAGSVLTAGLGALNALLGIFTLPIDIATIIECYYNLPPMLVRGTLVILGVTLAYILLSAKVGSEV